MDSSNPTSPSDLLAQEGKPGSCCLQKSPGFPPRQKASDSPSKDKKEISTQGGEERHRDGQLCENSPEHHGIMETSSKETKTLRKDINTREEKLVWLDISRSGENLGAAVNDQKKPSTAEGESTFHTTQKNKHDHLGTLEKDNKDHSAPGCGISKETLQELKNLLRESPLLSTRARNTAKPGDIFSRTLLLNASDKQSRHVETFHPHLRGGDQKIPTLPKRVAGQVGKSQAVHSPAGLNKQQTTSDDMEHPVVRQQTSSHNTGSTPGIKLDPTPGQHGKDVKLRSLVYA